jgi:hypothetical protein
VGSRSAARVRDRRARAGGDARAVLRQRRRRARLRGSTTGCCTSPSSTPWGTASRPQALPRSCCPPTGTVGVVAVRCWRRMPRSTRRSERSLGQPLRHGADRPARPRHWAPDLDKRRSPSSAGHPRRAARPHAQDHPGTATRRGIAARPADCHVRVPCPPICCCSAPTGSPRRAPGRRDRPAARTVL